jgi:hypothetical protein
MHRPALCTFHPPLGLNQEIVQVEEQVIARLPVVVVVVNDIGSGVGRGGRMKQERIYFSAGIIRSA